MRRVQETEVVDFSGCLHSNAAITELELKEAHDLSNIIVGPKGDYFRTKFGNSTFNSVAMNSGVPVQSLSYYKLVAGTEFLVSICGTQIFSSPFDGTMTGITGGVTITAGQDNIWTFLTFNNIHIGFGGPATNPDTPIQWTGAGNVAALSGTPPAAYGAVQANNRVFAFRTAAAPSLVQWSVLGNPQDWTSTGSGSQNVSTSDNDSVTAMAPLNNNVVLIFKENSVHKLMVSTLVSGAFPTFLLFKNVGCVGKHACVVADGLCYFITPNGTMRITDGYSLVDEEQLPVLSYINDIWAGGNLSRYQYIQGQRVSGRDYDHIIWLFTSTSAGTTHDRAIRWDINNKGWLLDKSGYKANVITQTQSKVVYTGHYAGIIYKQDVSSLTTEASESAANVDGYWTSGWQKFSSFDLFKSIIDAILSFVTQTSGNILFSWGYNFNSYSRTAIIDQRSGGVPIGQFVVGTDILGGQSDKLSRISPIGNGRVFQYRIRNNDFKMKINSLTLLGKKLAQLGVKQ